LGGTFDKTTALAPIFELSPICIFPKIQAPAPISTSLPITGLPLTPPLPPIVTFCSTFVLAPILVS